MKQLKEYKEVIHKCSKCGLCQSVCPTYLETGNECTVSRGQFIMLQGVIKGDLKMNKNINKYLDLCLKCGKCSGFCPSDIDVVEVILSAKHEYFKNSLEGKFLSILQSKWVFNPILNIVKFLFGRQKKFKKKFSKRAVYFGGCIESVFPKTSEYVKTLLNDMEIEVVDIRFNCCGLPFLTSGNLDRFEEQAMENIARIKDLEFDYFVTDCASCEWAWREYCKRNIGLVDNFEDKIISIYELLKERGVEFEAKAPCSVTYHNPCHEKRDIETLIKSIKNIEYKELETKDKCCGFAGLLKPSGWRILGKIMDSKKKSIETLEPDYVLATCVGCVLSMGLITGFKRKVMRLIDFLRKNCNINKE